MTTEADLAAEDALYTKLDRLGVKSMNDLYTVLKAMGERHDPAQAVSRYTLEAVYEYLQSRRQNKRQSHRKRKVDYGQL